MADLTALAALTPDLTYFAPFQLLLCRRHGLFIPEQDLDYHCRHHYTNTPLSTLAGRQELRKALTDCPLYTAEQDFYPPRIAFHPFPELG